MSMSDKEDCTNSFGPGTSNFHGVVNCNEFEPSVDKIHQSPNVGRKRTNPVTARSKRSSLNQLSSRSCTLLKDPLPPINRQSSVVSSGSEASIDARRHCGRLNYPVYKPPCFEHDKTGKKSRTYIKDNGDARHSDEYETITDKGKISPSGENSNRTVLSEFNFNLLYGKERPREPFFPNCTGGEEVSDTSESEQPKVTIDKEYVLDPNFRSYWDLTGMYQTGGSSNTGPLQVCSFELPESPGGKSDSDSLRNSEQLGSSARMRRREKKSGSFSTSFSQSACTSSPYSPYAPSPNAMSSTNSPGTPYGVDLEGVSSKSNDDMGDEEQLVQVLQDFKQHEKAEEKCTEDIDEVLKSYRSVNSEMHKVKRRFFRDACNETDDSSPRLLGKAESIDKFEEAVEIHPENTKRSLKSNPVLTARSNLVRKKPPTNDTAKGGARKKSSCSSYPSSPNKIETLSTCSDIKSSPMSVHRNLNESIKVTERADIQSSRVRKSVKMGVQSLQDSPKHDVNNIWSNLIALEEPEEKPLSPPSARVGAEHSPRLSIKHPDMLSAKFSPDWPEVRTQILSSNAFKESSQSSLHCKRTSTSPTSCKDNCNSYPNLQSKKKIKPPNFPKSLDNSPKKPCPLSSRSLQIQRLKQSPSPPLPRKRKPPSVLDRPRKPSPFDFRLNLPPSPSPPPPSPHQKIQEESIDYPSDPNWIRMEPFPGCVQYCPLEQLMKQIELQEIHTHRSALSPFESSGSSKLSKKSSQCEEDEISVESSIETNEIAVQPCIVATVTQKERNSEIFQQKKYNMKSSPGSLPAWAGGSSGRRIKEDLKFTGLMNRQEDYKMANAWFESEISGSGPDRHFGTNQRVQTPVSPVSAAKAVEAATPAEDDPPAPSQISDDSAERDFVLDAVSLETVPENEGLCTRLGNLCRSMGSRWFAESDDSHP